ncbi:hypothetical protein M1367_03490 [Candidatus Marsarchaeota archaeon]|nr:hypothetical protein [Candidatus Marsarchaeota archaeon]
MIEKNSVTFEENVDLNVLIFANLNKKLAKLRKINSVKEITNKDILNIISAVFSLVEDASFLLYNRRYKIKKVEKERIINKLSPNIESFLARSSKFENIDKNSTEYVKGVLLEADKFFKELTGLSLLDNFEKFLDTLKYKIDSEQKFLDGTKFNEYYNSAKTLVDNLYNNAEYINKLALLSKNNKLLNEDQTFVLTSINGIESKARILDKSIKHWNHNSIMAINDAYHYLSGIYEKEIRIVRLFVEIAEGQVIDNYDKIHFDHLRNNIFRVKKSRYSALSDIDIVMRNALSHNSFYVNDRDKNVIYKDEGTKKIETKVYNFNLVREKTINLTALVIAIALMNAYMSYIELRNFIKIISLISESKQEARDSRSNMS